MRDDMLMESSLLMQKFIDSNAVMKGHFVLSSGLHSDTYIQCAKIFENPQVAVEICSILVKKIGSLQFDTVLSPAIGGITVGYEIARQLKKRFVFCERVSGKFTLRRDFEIKDNDKVLIVEDVITTGKSSIEASESIGNQNCIIAVASLVKRSDVKLPFDVITLLDLNIKNYHSQDVPDALKNIPIYIPGSRYYSTTS